MKKDVDRGPVAGKIKRLREARMLTQRQLADKAGISESAMRSYELGDRNPKREVLERIAKALGVRPEYLTAPQFSNEMELMYAIFDAEDAFGVVPVPEDVGIAAVKPGDRSGLLVDAVVAWAEAKAKLESGEMSAEEYADWKATYDPHTWVDGKSPWTGK